MFKWMGGLIDRLFAVLGALLFTQIPLFMLQYQHQLSGHVAELQTQIQAMSQAAALTGKSLPQYILKFLNSGDADFKNQGEIMQAMMHRFQSLLEGLNALQDSSIYTKPFLFIRYFDWNIARSAWSSFEWGISFNLEGMVYAIIGITFGLLLYLSIYKISHYFLQRLVKTQF